MIERYGSPSDVMFSQGWPKIDHERDRVQEFEHVIGNLAITQIVEAEIDFTDRVPVKRAIERFMTYEYSGSRTLYLAPKIEHLGNTTVAQFSPRVARSGKNSAHGVFFGDLAFDDGRALAVAVKPHTLHDATNSSLVDYFNGVAVNKLGLFSLQPAGCLLDTDNRAYSLTVLDETLTTLDSIDWTSFYPDMDKHPGMQQIWSQIARQLGLLHSAGAMTHGDLAGRNIAVTADNYAFLIDWERAHISTVQPGDAEVRYEWSHPDLASLLESMCRPPHDDFKAGLGIFYGDKGAVGNWWQGFREMVFDEYVNTRQGMADTTTDKYLKAEVKSELQVLGISLLNDMRMMHGICQDLRPLAE